MEKYIYDEGKVYGTNCRAIIISLAWHSRSKIISQSGYGDSDTRTTWKSIEKQPTPLCWLRENCTNTLPTLTSRQRKCTTAWLRKWLKGREWQNSSNQNSLWNGLERWEISIKITLPIGKFFWGIIIWTNITQWKRKEIVKAYVDGKEISEINKNTGISRSTIYL